jgi:hypothetical protein
VSSGEPLPKPKVTPDRIPRGRSSFPVRASAASLSAFGSEEVAVGLHFITQST